MTVEGDFGVPMEDLGGNLDNNLGSNFRDLNTCTQETYHGTLGNCSSNSTALFWSLITQDSPLEGVSFTSLYVCNTWDIFSSVTYGLLLI